MRDGEGVAELALVALLVVAEVVAAEEAVMEVEMEVETLLEDACEAVAAKADRGASLLTEDDAAMLREREAMVTMAMSTGGEEEELQSWRRGRSGKLDPAASAIAMPIRSPPLSECGMTNHRRRRANTSARSTLPATALTGTQGSEGTRANSDCIDDRNMNTRRLPYLQLRQPPAFLAPPLTLVHSDCFFCAAFGEEEGAGEGFSHSGVCHAGGLNPGIGVPSTTWCRGSPGDDGSVLGGATLCITFLMMFLVLRR